ncbi:MAG: FAD-binding oxidoreductase, partial [Actinobacteria bacterium]|nr:FAD-binding oxidoreductase [Actinomycetota bacterium]
MIGAGFSGSLAALRLARLGHAVTVVDRGSDWWSGASGVGEGKVHLGYVYLRASEAFLETTVRAALLFQRGVEEAVGKALDWPTLRGVDFVYQFGEGSAFGPVEFRRHAERLAEIADRVSCEAGDRYLGRGIDRRRIAEVVEDAHAMRTPESMVDVPMLRREVVAAIAA